MQRSTVRFTILLVLVLACWGARAEPPTADPADVSRSDSIREFREGWGMLGNSASLDDTEYEELIARMERLVTELGSSGEAGHQVLIEHLLTRTRPIRCPRSLIRSPYTRVKVAIANAAARFELRQAIPALTEVLVIEELAEDRLAFEAYRRLSVAVADALVALDGREAVPVLRESFNHVVVWSRGGWAAPMLRHFPAALVALGDNSWLEDRLIELLNSGHRHSMGTAAFVAQQTRGDKVVPHLIARLRETKDPKAEWSLRQISGQSYAGSESWEAWWKLNAAKSRDDWMGLPPTSSWKEIWARDLFDTIRTQFLCNRYTCWRKAGYADAPAAAALEIAARVHALGIEDRIVARLREQLDNHTKSSCCRIWGSSYGQPGRPRAARAVIGGNGMEIVPQAVEPDLDPYCGCNRRSHISSGDSVAAHAERLLNAIACVGGVAPCEDFDLSMKVAKTAAPDAPAPSRSKKSAPRGRSAASAEDFALGRGVSFEISATGWPTQDSKSYVAGQPILIRCVWKNRQQRPVSLDLKDHDDYHGTLDYPVSMSARVVDRAGTVLTENDAVRNGWWSWYLLWSTTFEKMPGDVVTLRPGEEVVRIVPLDKILLGLETLRGGLSEGTYRVRLRLGMGEVVSNPLEIEIREE